MKRLFLVTLMLCTWAVDALAVEPTYEITRDRRRIGYKTVTECTGCEGRNTLNCEGAGLTGCRPNSIISGGTVLTAAVFDVIDLTVETKILASNGAPGKFVHGDFVVTYRYLEESGKVNYQIYPVETARELGIIPNI